MAHAQRPTDAEQLHAPHADEVEVDEEDRVALRAAILEGRAEIARGEGIPLEEVLAEAGT